MMPWWAWLLLALAAWCTCSLPVGLIVGRAFALNEAPERWRLPDPHEPVVHQHRDELRARRDLQARSQG